MEPTNEGVHKAPPLNLATPLCNSTDYSQFSVRGTYAKYFFFQSSMFLAKKMIF